MTEHIRIGVSVGAVCTWLCVLWFCRAPVKPAGVDDALFREAPDSGVGDYVSVTVHSLGTGGAMRMDVGDSSVGLENVGARWNPGTDSSVGVTVPQYRGPNPVRADTASRGLFDADTLDPYEGLSPAPKDTSWGWLANDVSTAERNATESLTERRSVQDRRFYDNGTDSFGRRDRTSGSDAYFYRQDRRF